MTSAWTAYDAATAIEAFLAGPERRVDVATVGERLFVSNNPCPLTGLGGRPRLDAGMLELSALRRTEGQELGRALKGCSTAATGLNTAGCARR